MCTSVSGIKCKWNVDTMEATLDDFFDGRNECRNCLLDRPVKSTDTGYANCCWWTSYFCDWIYGICIEITSRRESRIASRVKQMKNKNTDHGFVKFRSNKYAHKGLKNYDWFINKFITMLEITFYLIYYNINLKLGFFKITVLFHIW